VGVAGYLQLLRRRAWGMVACVVLGVGAAVTLSLLATPTYTSTAGLFFSLQHGNTANDLAQGATFTRDQMASYATLATAPVVLGPVIEELDLDTDPSALAHQVAATAPNDTVVLSVSVTSTSPEEAARIAGAVADRLVDVVEEVAPADTEGRATVRVTPVAPAEVPDAPSSPDTTLNALVGLVGGVALGALYAFLRETLDTRVRDARRVEGLTDAPILGRIPAAPAKLPVATAPQTPHAELFRQLRTNLEFLRVEDEPFSLVVSSSLPGEGKSTVTLNLALAFAEVNERVLLVDADMRRPSVAERLDLEGAAGLSTVLVGRARIDDVVQEWGEHGLHVLTAGALPPNPAQLLDSPRMTELLAELESRYDVVVVDSPPVLPVTDAQLLARHTRGLLMVADSRQVRRHHLAEALRQLTNVDTRLLGVVLNRLKAEQQVYGYGAYQAPAAAAAGRPFVGGVRRTLRPVRVR
jgi:succinoglycan biosynthesis transport protein ExoP